MERLNSGNGIIEINIEISIIFDTAQICNLYFCVYALTRA